MSHLKKAQVLMLPTNKGEAQLGLYESIGKEIQLITAKSRNWDYIKEASYIKPQHLYIFSDEEIKEGDWYIDLSDKENVRPIYKKSQQNGYKDCKKIIATTDTSIRLGQEDTHSRGVSYYLQPSQSFLEVYVREYNKGNVIKEVMVEYNEIIDEDGRLKVNSKDNTITIKRMKDNFTIFEIKQALHKAEIEHNKDYSKIWKIMESNFG